MDDALPPTVYHVSGECTLARAHAYCARLTASHYENFLVSSVFVPRTLRPHFHGIYAFCRIADDLADESRSPDEALRHLDWWEGELDACMAGHPRHPAMIALADTNREFGIPPEPYRALLSAFRQDQTVRRYETYADLLSYCERSANPVGRLVLMLAGARDTQRAALSDATCTALQLVNLWQDVARDWTMGRLYLPAEDMRRFGVTEADLAARRATASFRTLLSFECERADALFLQGAPLAAQLPARLRVPVAMFTRGGTEVLRRIAAADYDVLSSRPSIPKSRQLAMLAAAALRSLVAR